MVETLTDEQALSILDKMAIEQQTLQGLWGQFSSAVGRSKEIILKVKEARVVLTSLTERESFLRASVARLEPEFADKKAKLIAAEDELRRGFEKETAEARARRDEAREQQRVALADLDDFMRRTENARKERQQTLDELEDKIARAEAAIAEFKKVHGL